MPEYTDQLGRRVLLPDTPKRIVSLVPSQTELLFDLGLDEAVVGITKFCIHPQKWFQTKTKVGGTKNCNIALIRSLQPDLIIANKEENTQEQIEAMSAFAPVWVSDIVTYADAVNMIGLVGKILNSEAKAMQLIATIDKAFQQLPPHPVQTSVAYLIWKEPFITIGADTFIHTILSLAGYRNVFADRLRYPEISITDIQLKAPRLLFLSSEPYPFRQKHIGELQALLPGTRIHLVNGEMFSWYGSRLQHTPGYLLELLQSTVL